MEISFHGATKTVTGSKHLITLENNEKILLDCGMFQGMGIDTHSLNHHFGFEPSSIDYVILTHAHIDHSGLIPKLVKDGYKGSIYCTPATIDLCTIMLRDSALIQEADVRYINKRKIAQHKSLVEPLYTQEDAENCMKQFIGIEYEKSISISKDVQLKLTDNGHILGSATINLQISENQKTHHISYTGDIGRYGSSLLKDPAPFPQADILICESTYGDRLHEKCENAEIEILETIINTCKYKKGKVIIPAFSLGRTQELVYSLNKLNLKGLLPDIKIYVDSPLAVNATNVMRKYAHSLNDKVQQLIKSRPDPFGFDWLTYINDKRESQALNNKEGPFVLISSAGMAEAGRIKHHLMNTIRDKKNTILIVGYAEGRSLAGRLRRGDEYVSIYGKEFKVNAEVKVINSLSAHGDYKEIIRFLSCQDPKLVKQLFLVHGDPEVQFEFKKKLHEIGYDRITIPDQHSYYYI